MTFERVLKTAFGLCRQTFDSASTEQKAMMADFINLRMLEAWDWVRWPEWCKVQKRYFAEDWRSDLDYVTGEVVWHATAEAYYEALQDHSGKDPETETAYWEECSAPAERMVAWEQNGEDKIGRVWRATKNDPRTATANITYLVREHESGIYLPECEEDGVWVEFNLPPPQYTALVWSGTVTYQRYDLVYLDNVPDDDRFPVGGLVYQADIDEAGAQIWVPVYFPALLAPFICRAAAADMLRHLGKDEQTVSIMESKAYELLNGEATKWDPPGSQRITYAMGV